MRSIVIWVIDDLDENHALVERSLPEGWEERATFHGWLRAENALAAADAALGMKDDVALPDLVFMDFFITSMHGDEATRDLLALYAKHERAAVRPFIVGHSSLPAASAAIVRAGGDVVIQKPRTSGRSKPILELLPDLDALEGYRRVGA